MSETVESIAKWHKETFPGSTLEAQNDKFVKEFEEWRESGYQDILEIADMYIVACGLKRFSELAFTACMTIITCECYKQGITTQMLENAVNKKMEVNRKRIFEYNNGMYQHRPGIED